MASYKILEGTTMSVTSAYDAAINATTLGSTNETLLSVFQRHPDFPQEFAPLATFVDKFLTPLWYIIGIPGNIFAFIIWIQPRMRPSSGSYLAALAMDDLVFLMFKFIFDLQNTWLIPVFETPVVCEAFPVLFLASQYFDPLLVLGFTVERYISICHPFQREKYCTTRRAVKVIIGLLVMSFLLHVIQAYFWQWSQEKQCHVRDEVLAGGNSSLWSIWSWVTELLVFGVVPLAILVLNILVIKEVKKMSESEEKRLCLKKGHKSSSHGPSATTFMLLVVSFYLIFTTLPVTVCYATNLNFPYGDAMMSDSEILADATWQRHLKFWTIRRLLENFGMSHYACNFYLYLLTGKVFRKEFKRMFLRRCLGEEREKQWNGDFQELRGSQRDSHSAYSTRTTNGAIAHV